MKTRVLLSVVALWGAHHCGASFSLDQVSGRSVESEADLASIWHEVAVQFQPISPPGIGVYIHSVKIPIPASWDGFDKKTTQYMTAEMNSKGLPEYKLLIYEDVATRDRVISLASSGWELARIPAPKDYIPEAYYSAMLSKGALYSDCAGCSI
jgi:hypothetical protein